MVFMTSKEYRLASKVLKLLPLRGGHEVDTERGQAMVRVVIVVAAALYSLGMLAWEASLADAGGIYWLFAFSVPFSFSMLGWVVRRPGVNLLRRVMTMSHDYGGMTYAMAIGNAPLLPVFAILVWVTVGNGLRFGATYLIASTGLALLSLGVTTYFNDYWRANPYVVMTLVGTALLVPMYIYVPGSGEPRSAPANPCDQSVHRLPAGRGPADEGTADGGQHRPVAAKRVAVVQVTPGRVHAR